MKRAYCLYRVSTKNQVDVQKDDIPMQKIACHEFANAHGWVIAKEFSEKGDTDEFRGSRERVSALRTAGGGDETGLFESSDKLLKISGANALLVGKLSDGQPASAGVAYSKVYHGFYAVSSLGGQLHSRTSLSVIASDDQIIPLY